MLSSLIAPLVYKRNKIWDFPEHYGLSVMGALNNLIGKYEREEDGELLDAVTVAGSSNSKEGNPYSKGHETQKTWFEPTSRSETRISRADMVCGDGS
jgi:hypothetical protein